MAKGMKYITVISAVLTILFVILCQMTSKTGAILALAITFGTITYHFGMRLLVGTIIDKWLNNKVDYNRKWFQPRSFEEKLYQRLRVKKWKDRMPTYVPGTFSTKEHTMEDIAQAMCQAEIVHEVIIVLSFVPLVLVPIFGEFWVFFITSLLSAAFDLMFVMMQRYNRPRIVKIIKRKGETL